jgi:hypothetical protein
MKISIGHASNQFKVVAFLTYLLCFTSYAEQIFAAGSSEIQPTPTEQVSAPEQPSITSPVSQNASALSLQQNGINNFASIGTTTVPNCGGLCFYGNIKSGSSSINGFNSSTTGSQFEGSLGFMWQITSPDQTNVETQRRLADSTIGKSEDELRFSWMKELTTAIRTGNMAEANGVAILLAPKLGKTPQQLLNEVIKMKL